MTEAPVLHPFLKRLATELLAKAERSTGTAPVRLRLGHREAPELHGQTDAEQVQRWVMTIEDWCRTDWVALVLAPPKEFAGFVDRKPMLELRNFDALAVWAGYTPKALRWQRLWLEHMSAHWAMPESVAPREPQGLLDYLARNPLVALEGLSMDEATQSLDALLALCVSGVALPLREASARVFQGRSKVLDNRDELLRLLGAAAGQFQESPIQLLVDIPNAFDEVIFIENLVTFERMADARRAAWRHSLLIYAAGFKGSARRLRSRQGCRLYLRASLASERPVPSALLETGQQAVEDWLFGATDQTVYFFGDLDFAGMRILASLREVFADAQAWAPGYGALSEMLERGGGHAPGLAAKELQTDPQETGCTYADQRLLPLMRNHGRFIDQEALNLDSLPGPGASPLTECPR